MHAFVSALEPTARIVVATLFDSLWESALLALAVLAILRIFPNLNATTRYAAWCAALVGSLLLPLATAIPQISVQRSHAAHTVTGAWSVPATSAQAPVSSSNAHAAAQSATAATTAPARPALRLGRLHFALPQYVALALFGVWTLAALLMLARLAVNLWRLERLKTDALPLPVDYRDRLSQWTIAEKGGRDVRLCICDRIEVPVAVGLFDSMILIPQHLLETLTQDEVDQIMLHELAHLRRADDWTNGVQRVVQALFFFNPAVLYIAQQMDIEREVACDDWVVHQTREVRPYATCLTKMAEVTAWPHRPLAAPGVFVTRRGLSVRVERLLRAGRNVRTSISFGPAGAVAAALVVLFFVLQSVAPSFAFTLPAAPAAEPVASAWTPAPAASKAPLHVQQVRNTNHVIYTYKTVKQYRTVDVPAQHVNVDTPGVDVHVPPQHIHVNVPEQHIKMANFTVPAPHVSFPPGFSKSIAEQTQKSVQASLHNLHGLHVINGMHFSAADMQGMNCVGCDYSNQNLAGRSFRSQKLSGTDFTKTNLQNADFSGSVLVGVDFSGADLRGANFTNAKLNGCDFTHANIAGARFDGSSMVGCDVDAKALSPSQARAFILACRNGCDFSDANLSGQDLRGLALTGVDLSDADLRGADLSGAKLNGVDFSGARLDGARFDGTILTGCDLSGVDLRHVDLSKAKMSGDKLNGSSEP